MLSARYLKRMRAEAGNDGGAFPDRHSRKLLLALGVLAVVSGIIVASYARTAARAATGKCPVTIRGSTRRPPAAFVRTGLPVPYVRKWLGSRTIWIRLPRHGTIPAQRDRDGHTISAKFPWWRVVRGQLHAWAHPVGHARPRLSAQVQPVADYGPTGFVPSALRFSKLGCWRITGSLHGHSLSFVARVVIRAP